MKSFRDLVKETKTTPVTSKDVYERPLASMMSSRPQTKGVEGTPAAPVDQTPAMSQAQIESEKSMKKQGKKAGKMLVGDESAAARAMGNIAEAGDGIEDPDAKMSFQSMWKQLDDERKQVYSTYKKAKDRTQMAEVFETFGNALVMLGAGMYGLKTGVDMSGVQFNKSNWEAKMANNLSEMKTRLADIEGQRKELMAGQKAKEKDEPAVYKAEFMTKDGKSLVAQRGDKLIELTPEGGFKPYQGSVGDLVRTTGRERARTMNLTPPLPEEGSEEEKSWRPTEFQLDRIAKNRKEFKADTKKHREAILASNKIIDALDNPGKMTPALIKTQMPRLAGEVGNLAEFEQKAWTGDPRILNVIERKWNEWTQAETLTDEDISELRDITKSLVGAVYESQETEMESTINFLKDAGVPASYSRARLEKDLRIPKVLKQEAEKDPKEPQPQTPLKKDVKKDVETMTYEELKKELEGN